MMTFAVLLIWIISAIHDTQSKDLDLGARNKHLSKLHALTPLEAANLVREQFIYGYSMYQKYANGCDELYPDKPSGCHNYNDYSLLYTPIDSLDTMLLMNIPDLINDTINLICYSNFTFHHDQNVGVFDLFIRILGGLLSSYHLSDEKCLYNLAIDLADIIYPTFTISPTISGLPWTELNMLTGEINYSSDKSSPALSGTNIMEYGAISALTGNLKYYTASKNSLQILSDHRSSLGLVGDCINLNNTESFWCGTNSYIDGDIDSYYEYQLKCFKLFNDPDCYRWWINSNKSIIEYLSYYKNYPTNNTNELFNGTKLWFKRVNMNNGMNGDRATQYDLYAAYFSGVLSLSGQINLAKLNQEANWYMWKLYNIEPFLYDFENNIIMQQYYWLNPENIESNYYLYMITNDTLYYNRAIEYLNDIINYDNCTDISTCNGYAGLSNIINKEKDNQCPSYFFAETLKYLYLTFMRNQINNPLNYNDYIFTTEAHPFPKVWGNILQNLLKTAK